MRTIDLRLHPPPAIVTGLPVIVEVNKEHTLPQEQAVADWIRRMGVGVVVSR